MAVDVPAFREGTHHPHSTPRTRVRVAWPCAKRLRKKTGTHPRCEKRSRAALSTPSLLVVELAPAKLERLEDC